MEKERINWIDAYKGVLILLVVAGHAIGAASHLMAEGSTSRLVFEQAYKFIYLFHMPAFFFIAGVTFKPAGTQSFASFIGQKSRRLLIPYIVFGLFSALVFILASSAFDAAVGTHATDSYYDAKSALAWWTPLVGLLHGGGAPHGHGFASNSVLWFLPCLFTVSIAYWLLDRVLPRSVWQAVVAVLLMILPLSFWIPKHLPWGLYKMPYYLPFMILGRWIPAWWTNGTRELRRGGINLSIGIALLVLLVFGTLYSPNAARALHSWAWLEVFLGLALAGSLALFFLIRPFDHGWIRYLGRVSLTIMLLHKFPLMALQLKVGFVRSLTASGGYQAVFATLLVVAVCVCLCIVADAVIGHYAPILLGKRSSPSGKGTEIERPATDRKRITAIDFWEDHCTECGEPDCFRTCPKFRRGAHGRCERVVADGDMVSFREWGKLELLWSGHLATPDAASRILSWNRHREDVAKKMQRLLGWLPVPYGRGPYGIFRSLRWRKAARLSRISQCPGAWVFEASSAKQVSLVFEVRQAKKMLLVRAFDFGSDSRRVEIPLPPVEKGTHFSVRPADGMPAGPIRIVENSLIAGSETPVKCVAWDLDGTLWMGTLSEGDEVVPFPSAVEAVKLLDGRGIVNSICSKNNSEEALAKLAELGLAEYFVFPQIGWGPKSDAIMRLAKEMNISTDSIVFVDDAKENLREVSERVPGVRVLRPEDVATALSRPEFNPPVSAESSARRCRYREEMARRRAASEFGGSAEDFATVSGLEVEILPVEGVRLDRCLELVQRTNLLNLTGRRYDAKSFSNLLETSESAAVRARDAYGDYGTVGFIAWRGTHIVECCFSCRIANRGVERRALDAIAAGRPFTADSVETPRNEPIRKIVEEWMKCH